MKTVAVSMLVNQCRGKGPYKEQGLGSRQVAQSSKQAGTLVHRAKSSWAAWEYGMTAGAHAEFKVLAWTSLQTVHPRPLVKIVPKYPSYAQPSWDGWKNIRG